MTANSNVLNGFRQPADSSSTIAGGIDNQLFIYGTVDAAGDLVTSSQVQNALTANVVTRYSAPGAIKTNGIALLNGGTGFSMSLATPTEGSLLTIRLASITPGGSVAIVADSGVSIATIYTTATFNLVGDSIVLAYSAANQWLVVENNNVVLS